MFKKPLKVEIDAQTTTVEHQINVTSNTMFVAQRLISRVGTTAISVIAVAALAKTSSEIIVHIAKTTIK